MSEPALPDLYRGDRFLAETSGATPDVRRMTSVGRAASAGLLVLALGIAAFSVWAALAPLHSAVVAPGVVIVETRRQQVEHLEGGIIRAIHVRDGDTVREGDLLIELASEASTSRLDQTNRRVITLLATRDRLRAEIDGDATISFDSRLSEYENASAVAEDVAMQQSIFSQRRLNLEGRKSVFLTQIQQVEATIRSLNARLEADRIRLSLTLERIDRTSTLVERGLTSQLELDELLAQEANLTGSVRELEARIEESEFEMQRLRQELGNIDSEYQQSVFEELQRVETELGEYDASASAATDVVERMQVLAPVSGTIVGMAVNSVGSVVDGGELLMEIVPSADRLVIEALVRPEDIDIVAEGLPVLVRLTAFNQRTTPPANGFVETLSADRVLDQRTGLAAYAARITLTEPDETETGAAALLPGMPVEVSILNEPRTFLDYLLGPAIDVFRRGLRD